ncbi:spindle and kinetochore-associated protein 3 isoform X1 [Anolis carolinensis]|uniref:spindle and kinetochore-associated protein 3 isoform X1 n=2 Tax=Anolis carolinensis TaxID=28377 RepID=UPI002F2B50AD
MDVTSNFFDKLRTIALTLERESKHLKQGFHGNDTEFEDDSPMTYLHEMYSDIRTLKSEADNILQKSSSERDTAYDFLKASKVLMKRNAGDLEEIRQLIQKYGYKPPAPKDTAMGNETEIHSRTTTTDHMEPKDLGYSGKSSGPVSPLQIPQLSDFGLSKYALPSTSSTMCTQPQVRVPKKESRRDNNKCLSPKAENFHIRGRDLCVNDVCETTGFIDDQTIFLLNNAKHIRQANKLSGSAEVSTPSKNKTICDDDYMASPASPQFCTPGVKIPRRKNAAVSKSPTTSDVSDRGSGNSLADSQSLQTEAEQIYVTAVSSKKDVAKGADVPVLYSNECLKCEEKLRPPVLSDYINLLGSPPPPPEISVIPNNISQILSKYNPNREVPRYLEETKKQIASQVEISPVLGIGNKENWKYSG